MCSRAAVFALSLWLAVPAVAAGGTNVSPVAALEPAPPRVATKIDSRLLKRLRALRRDEGTSVSIRVYLRSAPTPQRGETREQYLKELRAAIVASRRGVLRALARMGARYTTAALVPVVFARLTRTQVFAIARRPDVRKIYGPDRNTRFGP